MRYRSISNQTLQRLPLYLNYLKSISQVPNISATSIAQALGLNDVQVRKDLALVSDGGRPKVGYITQRLIFDIEQFLGYGDTNSTVLVGAGNLGRALLSYKGFCEYGIDIVAAFDIDKAIVGTSINGKQVLHVDKLKDLCNRMKIKIGIIAVPASEAQNVCNMLIESGIVAIWNFAPVHLNVPKEILVQNENMALSLAMLSKNLTEKLFKNMQHRMEDIYEPDF